MSQNLANSVLSAICKDIADTLQSRCGANLQIRRFYASPDTSTLVKSIFGLVRCWSALFGHGVNMLLNLLGAARLTYQGEALEVQKKNLALICYLALQNRPCPRDDLTELLWGAGRSGSLRTALYKLRQLPDAKMWLLDGDRVEICVQSDVGVLRRDRDAPNLSSEALACLDLYLKEGQGLLFGFKAPTPAYGEWLEEERQRVTLLLDDLMERAAHEALEAGQTERAQTYAEALIARNPLDEPAYRLLMQLEHGRGYPEHAQRTFERLSAALEEVGGPSRETLELHRQLLGTSSGAQGRLLNPGDEVPARAPTPHRAT